MIDFSLTEEQLLLQRTAREFAEKELKPIDEEIQRLERERAKYNSWEICREAIKKGTALGFTKMIIPEKYGGLGRGLLDHVIVQEELSAIGGGPAGYLIATFVAPIMMGGTEAQKEKWLRRICEAETFILASAGNEPDVAGSNFLCPFPDPKIGIKTFAKREGDEYVINGAKAAFCTNAGIADAYFVMTRTDLSKPTQLSSAIFYVPADTPGLSFGKTTEMLGGGIAPHAEVYLDDVRVPAENRIGGGDGDGFSSLFVLKSMPYLGTGLASSFVGLARAAYDYARDYAKQRMSWGVPIINHQLVSSKLADMYVDYETARYLTWNAAWAIDNGSPMANVKALAAKTHAVEVAIRNSEKAVKILGGYGVTKEYKTPGFLCAAWGGWSCDGTGDMLRLAMMNFLEGPPFPPPGAAGGGPPPGGGFPGMGK